MGEAHDHHVVPAKTYVNVLLILLVLTVITVAAAQFDFGVMNTFIAIIIATVKAAFVAAIFMNLKYDSKLHIVVFAAAIFFLVLLYSFSVIDIVTRVPVEGVL